MEASYTGLLVLSAAVMVSGCIHTGETQKPAPIDDSQNNTVFYTDSGFQPEKLVIERGETVTWFDRSPNPMWVASDFHPSHTRYDGTSLGQHCPGSSFDQCSTGKRFSFTFEKKGSWGYHNHELAGHTGTIVVR